MKLIKIVFENFRQFYGKQEVDLDITNDKNIIVIHGENGAGKTTILEGFSWCLYGKLDLIQKDNILNEKIFFDLEDGNSADVKVSLFFNDRHKEYIVSRFIKIQNIGKKQLPVRNSDEFKVMQDGNISSNPKTVIDKIMSRDLKKYFFFDGERIDKLAKPESAKDIEEGIKNIMGISVYEKAISHLKQVSKELSEELKKVSPENSVSPYEEQQQTLDDLDEIKIKLKNNTKRRDDKKSELKMISEKIKEVEELEKYEKERQKLEENKNKLKDKQNKQLEAEKNRISKNAYLAISNSLIEEMNDFLKNKREKGELPSGIREQFIQDLIEEGKCICGTAIEKNDKHYTHLKKLLENTVKKDVEDGFLKLNGFTSKFMDSENIKSVKKEEFIERLKRDSEEKKEIIDELNGIESELSELDFKIKEQAKDSTSEQLVQKRYVVENEIEELTEKIGEQKKDKERLEKTLDSIKIAITKHQAENRQMEIAEKRLELAQHALKKLNNTYEETTSEVRKKLSQKVSNVFTSIVTAYNATINDKFELSITKNVNGYEIPVGTSTGENQIASLSFIGSLVSIAKEWDEDGKGGVLTGAGTYPIVMDSPFGSLDSEYRDLISDNLQRLAPQIVVLVSTSQWSNEVEKNLKPFIQHEYILQYHNPNQEDFNASYKSITIDDTNYDLSVKSDYEYTKIIKAK